MPSCEAGYIDARPLTANSTGSLATHGRTIGDNRLSKDDRVAARRAPRASVPMCWSADRSAAWRFNPLSLQGQTGINVAAGIGELELHPAR
jgi:hypothetical protein